MAAEGSGDGAAASAGAAATQLQLWNDMVQLRILLQRVDEVDVPQGVLALSAEGDGKKEQGQVEDESLRFAGTRIAETDAAWDALVGDLRVLLEEQQPQNLRHHEEEDQEDQGGKGRKKGRNRRRRRRRRKGEETGAEWEDIDAAVAALRPRWEEVVTKWHTRVSLHHQSGGGAGGQGVFRTGIWEQASAAADAALEQMAQEEQQQQREEGQEDGEEERPGAQEEQVVYDDSKFYRQLLKDLVAGGAFGATSAAATGPGGGRAGRNADAELRAADRRYRKKKAKRGDVNRRASKGRQIRYEVHPKLQNFMHPVALSRDRAVDADRLFESLFGRVREAT